MPDAFPTIPISALIEFLIGCAAIVAAVLYVRGRVKAHRITRALDRKPCTTTFVNVKHLEDRPYFLFFDTETTGLPKDFNAPAAADDNWPRLVQLSWIVTTSDGQTVSTEDHIIRPEGFSIPRKAARIHGITTKVALSRGEPLKEVLEKFAKDCRRCCLCVGHNVQFDKKVAGSEFLRAGMRDSIVFLPAADTMKSSVFWCRIPKRSGKYKWPRLQELHKKLFGKKFDDAHNSLCDVQATERCFWELKRHGVIQILGDYD